MGEEENEPFQFTFNGFLKVTFQGSRVTSDAGLILVRELDERLGLATRMAPSRSSRTGSNTATRTRVSSRSSCPSDADRSSTRASRISSKKACEGVCPRRKRS